MRMLILGRWCALICFTYIITLFLRKCFQWELQRVGWYWGISDIIEMWMKGVKCVPELLLVSFNLLHILVSGECSVSKCQTRCYAQTSKTNYFTDIFSSITIISAVINWSYVKERTFKFGRSSIDDFVI